MTTPSALDTFQHDIQFTNDMWIDVTGCLVFSNGEHVIRVFTKTELDAIDVRLYPVVSAMQAGHVQYNKGPMRAEYLRTTLRHWARGPLFTDVYQTRDGQIITTRVDRAEQLRLDVYQGQMFVGVKAQTYDIATTPEGYSYVSMIASSSFGCGIQRLEPLYPGCTERLTHVITLGLAPQDATDFVLGNALPPVTVELPAGLTFDVTASAS